MLFSFIILIQCCILAVWAQVSHPGRHTPLRNVDLSTQGVYRLPYINNRWLQKLEQADRHLYDVKDNGYRFGKAIDVNLSFADIGDRHVINNDGDWVWRLKVESPEALSLNLIFGDWFLPPETEAYVYNDKQLLGAFIGSRPSRTFATAPISGNFLIIEYFSPVYVKALPSIVLTEIIHGYKPFFGSGGEKKRATRQFYGIDKGSSGACNIDVACSAGDWFNQSRSVGVLLTEHNQKYCSGALINNAKQDGKQYFLTANHCAGWSDSTNHIVMFNHERRVCGVDDADTTIPQDTAHGLRLVGKLKEYSLERPYSSSFRSSDFTLYEIIERIPDAYNVYLAGWTATPSPISPVVGIHHPSGDVKKMSFYYGTLTGTCWSECPDKMHLQIERWSRGTTEPGSSGSPLFDSTHRIIGQLHGGSASCFNIQGYDVYGMFKASFKASPNKDQLLSTFLDPDQTDVEYLDGINLVEARQPIPLQLQTL